MRSRRPAVFIASLASVALAALLAAACGSDDGTTVDDTVTLSDLEGSWSASSHLYTNEADANESFDLIANGGETRVTVLSGGRARTWVDIGTFSDEWDAQLSISGNMITSTPAETTRPVVHFAFSLVGNVLTLTDSDAEFDFTLTGADPVPAEMRVVLVRQ